MSSPSESTLSRSAGPGTSAFEAATFAIKAVGATGIRLATLADAHGPAAAAAAAQQACLNPACTAVFPRMATAPTTGRLLCVLLGDVRFPVTYDVPEGTMYDCL
jgi:hypothetical protein